MSASTAVQFDRRDRTTRGEQGFGQNTGSGTDFQHVVFHIDLGVGHGTLEDVVVDQKVLSKFFLERLKVTQGIDQSACAFHAVTGKRNSIRRGCWFGSSISSTKR